MYVYIYVCILQAVLYVYSKSCNHGDDIDIPVVKRDYLILCPYPQLHVYDY